VNWHGIALIFGGNRIEIPFTEEGGSSRESQGFTEGGGAILSGAELVRSSRLKGRFIYTVSENLLISDCRLLQAWAEEQDAGNAGLIQLEDWWMKISTQTIARRNREAISGTSETSDGYTYSFFKTSAILQPNGDFVGGISFDGQGNSYRKTNFAVKEL
jgi:hypothetical protein